MSFHAPYLFKQNNDVVIRTPHGGYLRVSPSREAHVDGGGETGPFARWHVELHGGHAKIKSKKTGKYLRITPRGRDCDCGGMGGPFTLFKIHHSPERNIVRLESVKSPGNYVAAKPDKTIFVGKGGPHCHFTFLREGAGPVGGHGGIGIGHHHPAPPVHHAPPAYSHGSSGGGSFGAPYLFQRNNVVVIQSHKHGKYLRVSPTNTALMDGLGGQGEFAQWTIELEGHHVKLRNNKTGKYLRIFNDRVDVMGAGGPFTLFKPHRESGEPNVAKLESAKFPGKYVATKPNGQWHIGNGGPWTLLRFYRQGVETVGTVGAHVSQASHVHTQHVEHVDPLAAERAALEAQKAELERQRAAQELDAERRELERQRQELAAMQMGATTAAAASAYDPVLEAQRAEIERQKADLERQKQEVAQQAELQRQRAEIEAQKAALAAQQAAVAAQSASQSAASSSEPGAGATGGEGVVDDYKRSEMDEDKKAVVTWLSGIGLTEYIDVFFKNGFDKMDRIYGINPEDCSKMGIALGHTKTILPASRAARYIGKTVLLRSQFDYFIAAHKPGKTGGTLDHHDKVDKAARWEVVDAGNNLVSFKNAEYNTYLRLPRPESGNPVKHVLDKTKDKTKFRIEPVEGKPGCITIQCDDGNKCYLYAGEKKLLGKEFKPVYAVEKSCHIQIID